MSGGDRGTRFVRSRMIYIYTCVSKKSERVVHAESADRGNKIYGPAIGYVAASINFQRYPRPATSAAGTRRKIRVYVHLYARRRHTHASAYDRLADDGRVRRLRPGSGRGQGRRGTRPGRGLGGRLGGVRGTNRERHDDRRRYTPTARGLGVRDTGAVCVASCARLPGPGLVDGAAAHAVCSPRRRVICVRAICAYGNGRTFVFYFILFYVF